MFCLFTVYGDHCDEYLSLREGLDVYCLREGLDGLEEGLDGTEVGKLAEI